MDYGILHEKIRSHVRHDANQLQTVIMTTYSVYPPLLDEFFRLLLGKRRDEVQTIVFFQKWSFLQEDSRVERGEEYDKNRLERIVEYRRNAHYNMFRFRTNRVDRVQFHSKYILLCYPNRVLYVQYSHNWWHQRIIREPELLYIGQPQGLDRVWAQLQHIANEDLARLSRLEALPTADDALDLVALRTLLTTMAGRNQGPQEQPILMVQIPSRGPNPAPDERRLDMLVRSALHQHHQISDNVTDMWLHFPFVNLTSITMFCQSVVHMLTVNANELERTNVLLAAPDVSMQDVANDPRQRFAHESWACRLRGNQLLWFFLTSANLTLPSWGQVATNHEVGLLVFRAADLKAAVATHLRNQMGNMESSRLHPMDCSKVKYRFTNTSQRLVQAAQEVVLKQCDVDDSDDPWARYTSRKAKVVDCMLPGLVGAADVMNTKEMKSDVYYRFALYDILFHDLGRKIPLVPFGMGNRKQIFHTLRADDDVRDMAWAKLPMGEVTLTVLVDIFVKWSIVFDLFDRRITSLRPRVTPETLVGMHTARDREQILEDTQLLERKGVTSFTAHDSVTFLLQNMHNHDAFVWWTCGVGHRFWLSVANMMLSFNPGCAVCAKSTDILEVYNILQQKRPLGIEALTVEMPLKRRGTDKDGEELVKRALGEAYDQHAAEITNPLDYRGGVHTAYDLFFVYEDKWCAVEFDDPSHHGKSPIPDANANLLPREGRHGNPHADSVKNIMSMVMGIHLLRIYNTTNVKRPNAIGKLRLCIEYFLYAVHRARDIAPVFRVPRRPCRDAELYAPLLQNLLERRSHYTTTHPRYHSRSFVYPKIQQDDDDDDMFPGHPEYVPVLMILEISPKVPWSQLDALHRFQKQQLMRAVRYMAVGGQQHPSIRDKKNVVLKHYITRGSLAVNAHILAKYLAVGRAARFGPNQIRRTSLSNRVLEFGKDLYVIEKCRTVPDNDDTHVLLVYKEFQPQKPYPTRTEMVWNRVELDKQIRLGEKRVARIYPPSRREPPQGHPASVPYKTDCVQHNENETKEEVDPEDDDSDQDADLNDDENLWLQHPQKYKRQDDDTTTDDDDDDDEDDDDGPPSTPVPDVRPHGYPETLPGAKGNVRYKLTRNGPLRDGYIDWIRDLGGWRLGVLPVALQTDDNQDQDEDAADAGDVDRSEWFNLDEPDDRKRLFTMDNESFDTIITRFRREQPTTVGVRRGSRKTKIPLRLQDHDLGKRVGRRRRKP